MAMKLLINVANVDKCEYCKHKNEDISKCLNEYECNKNKYISKKQYVEFDLDEYLKNRDKLKEEFKESSKYNYMENTTYMKTVFPLEGYIHTSYIKDIILDKKIYMYHTGTGFRCSFHNYITKSFIDLIDFIYEADFEKKIKVYATRVKQADDKTGTQTEEWGILDFFETVYTSTNDSNNEACVKNMTINIGNKKCNVYLKKDDNSKDKLTVEGLFLYILEKKKNLIENKQEKLLITEEVITEELEVLEEKELKDITQRIKKTIETIESLTKEIEESKGNNEEEINLFDITIGDIKNFTIKIKEETERIESLKGNKEEINISLFNGITNKIEFFIATIREEIERIKNLKENNININLTTEWCEWYIESLENLERLLKQYRYNENKLIELLNNQGKIKKDMEVLKATQERIANRKVILEDEQEKVKNLLGMLEELNNNQTMKGA